MSRGLKRRKIENVEFLLERQLLEKRRLAECRSYS